MSLAGDPLYWPGGVRRRGGASPVCGFCMERGKADVDTAALAVRGPGARGSASSGRNREALSTVAASAGGPARSSGEASVTGVERRGRLICRAVHTNNRALPREEAGGHVGTAGQAVQHSETAGVEGIRESQGQQGRRR